jgi:hypothetical protein
MKCAQQQPHFWKPSPKVANVIAKIRIRDYKPIDEDLIAGIERES